MDLMWIEESAKKKRSGFIALSQILLFFYLSCPPPLISPFMFLFFPFFLLRARAVVLNANKEIQDLTQSVSHSG